MTLLALRQSEREGKLAAIARRDEPDEKRNEEEKEP
jgi:hypothetical protein